MIDLSTYSTVIYVDSVNGDDSTGVGTIDFPYKTIDKAHSLITQDDTLIYLQAGVYQVASLITMLSTQYRVTYVSDVLKDSSNKAIVELADVASPASRNPVMTKLNTLIGIIFKKNASNENRIFEYFYDASTVNLEFNNCVFDNGTAIVTGGVIFTGQSAGATIINMHYINCSIIPASLSLNGDTFNSLKGAIYTNCAFADLNYTTQVGNYLGVSFDVNYELINNNATVGVYYGKFKWQTISNKYFINNQGSYKKFLPKSIESNRVDLKLTANSQNGYVVNGTVGNSTYPLYRVFDGDATTYYRSQSSNRTATIQLTLPQSKFISEILISPYSTNYYSSYIIEGSNDEITWITLHTGGHTSFNDTSKPIALQKSGTYLNYRFTMTINSGSYFYLNELILYEGIIISDKNQWIDVTSTTPTLNQFMSDGMDSISPLLDRKIQELNPIILEDISSQILNPSEIGRVFSKSFNLSDYVELVKLTAKGVD